MMYKIDPGEAPSYMSNMVSVGVNYATGNRNMSFLVPHGSNSNYRPCNIRETNSKEGVKFK